MSVYVRSVFLPALVAAGLAGCGSTTSLPQTETEAAVRVSEPECQVSGDRLPHLLRLQQRYLQASSSEQRLRQLMEAQQSQDRALEGLLLTSPVSSPAEIKQGADVLGRLLLHPNDLCIADRYLFLHLSQVRHDLSRVDELKALQDENNELKSQIEALTDLEKQITRQRKDL